MHTGGCLLIRNGGAVLPYAISRLTPAAWRVLRGLLHRLVRPAAHRDVHRKGLHHDHGARAHGERWPHT